MKTSQCEKVLYNLQLITAEQGGEQTELFLFTPACWLLLAGHDLHLLLFCEEQTNQPFECDSIISLPLVSSQAVNSLRGCRLVRLRGESRVCLTRWSFLGFLYVLEWLQPERLQGNKGASSWERGNCGSFSNAQGALFPRS